MEPAAQSLRSSGTLLVADTSSTSSPPVGFAEYSLPNGSLLATVSDAPAGLSNPSAFAFDSKKNIYVLSSSSNGGEDPGDVLIFTRGATTPRYAIASRPGFYFYPKSMALDALGNLFVGNTSPQVIVEYSAGTASRERTFAGPKVAPQALAFDTAGNLFVASCAPCFYNTPAPGEVDVFAPGGKKPSYVISHGIDGPHSLAFDPSGNLFVINITYRKNAAGGNVTVYTHRGSFVRSLHATPATALAFDSAGRAFVAICPPCYHENGLSEVLVFDPGATDASRTITQGVDSPSALAVDSAGTLYVANVLSSTVRTYAPNTGKVGKTFEGPAIAHPDALAILP